MWLPRFLTRPFAVVVQGKGYLLQMEDGAAPVESEFYTCVGVRARSIDAAIEKAIDRVRKNPRLNDMMRNVAQDEPMLSWPTVYELGRDDDERAWDRGLVLYEREDDPDC